MKQKCPQCGRFMRLTRENWDGALRFFCAPCRIDVMPNKENTEEIYRREVADGWWWMV